MFEAVTLEYSGKEYIVPADKVWGLVSVIEQKTDGLYFLSQMLESRSYKRTVIVSAYHAALQYAGCRVTLEQLNTSLKMADVFALTATLIELLYLAEPPPDVDLGSSDQPGLAIQGKPEVGKSGKTGKASKPTSAG
jgi:hypothetical protein